MDCKWFLGQGQDTSLRGARHKLERDNGGLKPGQSTLLTVTAGDDIVRQ